MKTLARRVIPKALLKHLLPFAYRADVVRKLGGVHPRTCNICGYKGRFAYFGDPPRQDARCKGCDALERHRLLKLWVDSEGGRLAGSEVLHFAPEPAVARIVRPLAKKYVSADITVGRADIVINIEKIDLPDQSVDWIVCSHVLEHVDDAAALGELFRILRPGGTLTIMIPIVEGWDQTYENRGIATDAERELHFGQSDHIRFYGRDIRDRIVKAGFLLSEFTALEPQVVEYGLSRGEKVFVAKRPQ